jgi:hypothetical protein
MFDKHAIQSQASPEGAQAVAELQLVEWCEDMVMQGDFLADNDIRTLADWFSAYGNTEIRAIQDLGAMVRRVLTDGKATDEEGQQLLAAIEAVVAPEVRAEVHAKQPR